MLVVGAARGWTVSVQQNLTVRELQPVNVTCSTDYWESEVTFRWTSRSHTEFKRTGPNLWFYRATTDIAGDYECIVETERKPTERNWAPMHLTVLCKYR